MTLFDVILLCVIGGFGLFGLWFGLISAVGSLAGTLVGVYVASRVYLPAAAWLMNITGWTGNFSKVLLFIFIFLIINRLVGFVFYIIDKTLKIITRLPFLSGINRLLGLVFGLFEGVIVLGIIFYFINKFPLGVKFMAALNASKIAAFTVGTASILWPLVPEGIKALRNTIGF